MGKRKKQPHERTKQEKLVAHFASHSISAYAMFHPDLWGGPGRHEPADMIIVAGRALFFINMTESNSYFEDLVAHNVKQARDRMKEWKAGKPIRGSNEWRSFSIAWGDIDYIAVISVVDGPYAACSDHPLTGLDLPEKVKICTTLTSKVMYEIASLNGSARDILEICGILKKNHGRFAEENMAVWIARQVRDLRAEHLAQIPRYPTRIGFGVRDGELISHFDEFFGYLADVRKEPKEGMEVLADISWDDTFAAAAYVTSIVGLIEWKDSGVLAPKVFGRHTKFMVIVSTNQEGLADRLPTFLAMGDEQSVAFFYVLEFSENRAEINFIFNDAPAKFQIEVVLEAL